MALNELPSRASKLSTLPLRHGDQRNLTSVGSSALVAGCVVLVAVVSDELPYVRGRLRFDVGTV